MIICPACYKMIIGLSSIAWHTDIFDGASKWLLFVSPSAKPNSAVSAWKNQFTFR